MERVFALTWLFGAGHFARTPVFNDGERWVQQCLSWYAATGKLSLTLGHTLQPAEDIESAMGVLQTPQNAARCFGSGRVCIRWRRRFVGIRVLRLVRAVIASPMPEVEAPMSVRFAPVGLVVSRCYLKIGGS